MVADVVDRACLVAEREGGRVAGMTIRLGPLAGITAQSARRQLEDLARARLGRAPRIEVEEGVDTTDRGAAGIVLVSVRLEDRDVRGASR